MKKNTIEKKNLREGDRWRKTKIKMTKNEEKWKEKNQIKTEDGGRKKGVNGWHKKDKQEIMNWWWKRNKTDKDKPDKEKIKR